MRIYASVKSVGKRRSVLEKVPYEISDEVKNVKAFISEIVRIEVEKYNAKGTDMQIIPFLTREELEDQAETGKAGFGRIYSDRKADLQKAIENAIQCYEDGLVRIFQNEEELGGLEDEVVIGEGDCFTFMKFVFLAGRMW